jgi:signal transduction histidine kinase
MKGSPVRVRASALQNRPAREAFRWIDRSGESVLRKPARVGVSSEHPRGEIGVATAVGAAPAFVAEPKQTRAPPRGYVVLVLALAGCIAAVGSYKLSLAGEFGPLPHLHAALVSWIVLAYVGCGLIAWSRSPESRFGPLMVVAGFVPALSRLAETDAVVLHVIGESLLLLPPLLFIHVFLAYPSGRLVRRFDRIVVITGYSVYFGLDLVRLLCEVTGRDGDIALRAQRAGIGVVGLTAVVALVLRRKASGRPVRLSLEFLIACFSLALVTLVAATIMLSVGAPGRHEVRWVAFALLGMAPVLLLVGHLRARLARSAVGDLFVELRRDPGPAELQQALARALGDPSFTLLYWLPEFGTYADSDGRAVTLPAPTEARTVTHIERDGSRVAALLHDSSLEEEPELLDSVAAALSLSLENTQLHVELRARLEELRGSRARILESAQGERQRLERNLHDGAQQRLVALSLDLALLEQQLAGDRSAMEQIHKARGEVAASLNELREIARGIHPAVVTGHGLAVALEQLAAHAAVPIRLKVEVPSRLSEAIEVASYYVVAESLTNVSKYAQASEATVDVSLSKGSLFVKITDNGVGGADTERGSGLRGLADRVEALGGRLRVWSPVGGGTRVQAEIPCA